jgi:hypothetical protein
MILVWANTKRSGSPHMLPLVALLIVAYWRNAPGANLKPAKRLGMLSIQMPISTQGIHEALEQLQTFTGVPIITGSIATTTTTTTTATALHCVALRVTNIVRTYTVHL